MEIFEHLYYCIEDDKKLIEKRLDKGETIEEFLRDCDFNEEDIKEISARHKKGEKVYHGRLSNDNGNNIEAFFLGIPFVIIEEDFYFNAKITVY